MKKWHKSVKLIAFGLLLFGLTGGLFLKTALAATGQIYLSPASNSVEKNGTITLNLRINPGTAVDSLQATIYYDATKLKYLSYSEAGSAFSVKLQQTQSSGSINVARGDFSGGISNDSFVESVTFQALVDSGTSNVSLANAHATAAGTGTLTDPGTAGANVTFSGAAATTCPTGYTGTPPNCTLASSGNGGTGTGNTGTGTGGTSPGTTKPTGGSSSSGSTSTSGGTNSATPVPVTVNKETVQFTSAVISVTSAKPTQVYIKYGLSQKQLLFTTPLTDFATSHEIALDPAQLVPGTKYYYTVVSKDQAGAVAESAVADIKLKGIPLKVGIFDANHNPVGGKQVVLHSDPQTVKTDKDGYATFTDVSPGKHEVIYNTGGKNYTQEIEVVNNIKTTTGAQTAEIQNFSVVYSFTQSSLPWVRYIVYLIILAALAAGVYLFITKQRKLVGQPVAIQDTKIVAAENSTDSSDTSPSETTLPKGRADHMDQLKDIPSPSLPNPGATVSPQDERKNF